MVDALRAIGGWLVTVTSFATGVIVATFCVVVILSVVTSILSLFALPTLWVLDLIITWLTH